MCLFRGFRGGAPYRGSPGLRARLRRSYCQPHFPLSAPWQSQWGWHAYSRKHIHTDTHGNKCTHRVLSTPNKKSGLDWESFPYRVLLEREIVLNGRNCKNGLWKLSGGTRPVNGDCMGEVSNRLTAYSNQVLNTSKSYPVGEKQCMWRAIYPMIYKINDDSADVDFLFVSSLPKCNQTFLMCFCCHTHKSDNNISVHNPKSPIHCHFLSHYVMFVTLRHKHWLNLFVTVVQLT